MRPPFVMSKYSSVSELNKAKAAYYEQLARTFAANVDNASLSDAEFRKFVGQSLSEFASSAEDKAAAGAWQVTGDHPVLARPDRFGLTEGQANDYANELLALGYENVRVKLEG